MKRSYYSSTILAFLVCNREELLGKIVSNTEFDALQTQRDAWLEEIDILKSTLVGYEGTILFEYTIPRMGKRIDVVLIIGSVIFVLEFKVGEKEFHSISKDQVWDYALDLKYFHEPSHNSLIAPILIATKATSLFQNIAVTRQNEKIILPICCNSQILKSVLYGVFQFAEGPDIDHNNWEMGRYCPTPTIIEAAMALYNGHAVSEISRNEAIDNLNLTSATITAVIQSSKTKSKKSICFLTGVPGAGKTLVGLNIATQHIDKSSELYSVFLSGNGPLVAILREALARDKVCRSKEIGKVIKKGDALREVKPFIQNIHNFRDDCLVDIKPPIEHVAIFDEAQRAWNREQTISFMQRKKNLFDFNFSEPEFLISCLDRHNDWAVIVCLVGGGQEIHTGEAGISEWLESLYRSFPNWDIYISPQLTDSEYKTDNSIEKSKLRTNVFYNEALHLKVSMRSFRAENVSLLIKQLLDMNCYQAQQTLLQLSEKYPIVLTRDISKAKQWLKTRASGSERYGIIVSSQAQRLKPYAIDVKSPMEPIHWFLDGKEDVRSSYYLEDVATEFHVQGLELDWAAVIWDADFRYSKNGWEHRSFCGDKWNQIKKLERQTYQKNAYRVLLTRARQGMVIVVPEGDLHDQTRKPEFYDSTFEYLKSIGFDIL